MAFSPDQLSGSALELYDYWNRKSGSRRMPDRNDIDPTEIPHLLSSLTILDVEDHNGDPRFRHRLIGTAVVSFLGRDCTGTLVGNNFGGSDFEAHIHEILLKVVEDKEPLLDQVERPWSTVNTYNRLILPLSSDGETVDKFLLHIAVDFGEIRKTTYQEAVEQEG